MHQSLNGFLVMAEMAQFHCMGAKPHLHLASGEEVRELEFLLKEMFMKTVKYFLGLCGVVLTLLTGNTTVEANQPLPQHILIHMQTSLAER